MSGCECEIITTDSCTDGNHSHSTTLLHFLFDGTREEESEGTGGAWQQVRQRGERSWREREKYGWEIVHDLPK